jgi:hypothetical protein
VRFLVLFAALLSGCASTPYAELSLGYQLDSGTDYWFQTDRSWQCSKNVQFNGEIGVEFKHDWKIGLHHQSWLLCGGPFNSRPEADQNDIRITKKFGGK